MFLVVPYKEANLEMVISIPISMYANLLKLTIFPILSKLKVRAKIGWCSYSVMAQALQGQIQPVVVDEDVAKQNGAITLGICSRSCGLKYDVVRKQKGPSTAEQKLEELTRQLEAEMPMFSSLENECHEHGNRDVEHALTDFPAYNSRCAQLKTSNECGICGEYIESTTDACHAMGRLYHSNCFICSSCGRTLRGKAFYKVGGKTYCEEDYLYSGFQESADRCAICGHLITELILQATGRSYHPGCFRCCTCDILLDGKPFTLDAEFNIYCISDYHRLFAPKCAACNEPIVPVEGMEETVRVVAMEKDFHVDCYQCSDCGMQLTDEPDQRCYPLNGCLLCRPCHLVRLDNAPSSVAKSHGSSAGRVT